MATLRELIKAEQKVLRWDVELPPRQQPLRTLLILPRLAETLAKELPTAGSTWNIEETPEQQLDALTVNYVSGAPLIIGHQVKHLQFHANTPGVWYLKTADVRLFGWFPLKDHFIASSFCLTDLVKRLRLYKAFGREVADRRNNLPLDEPKFIAGEDPNAVVSNLTFPA